MENGNEIRKWDSYVLPLQPREAQRPSLGCSGFPHHPGSCDGKAVHNKPILFTWGYCLCSEKLQLLLQENLIAPL